MHNVRRGKNFYANFLQTKRADRANGSALHFLFVALLRAGRANSYFRNTSTLNERGGNVSERGAVGAISSGAIFVGSSTVL